MAGNLFYVHIGCGLTAPPSWRNFDASPTLRLQRLPLAGRLFRGHGAPVFPETAEYGDIVKGLPLAPGSCAAVYTCHVLEHLYLDECRLALGNIHAYLQPGGRLRVLLPDLRALARRYLDSTAPDAALEFVASSRMGMKSRPRGIEGWAREWIGNNRHRWMWDASSLSAELARVGFTRIREVSPGDSVIQGIEEVELPSRWLSSFGVECVRET